MQACFFYTAVDRKVHQLTEASMDSYLTKTTHSGDGKDQTDDCVASSVGVEFPTGVITVKGMSVYYC